MFLGDYMKYKYMPIRTYLVEEKKFIQLLEDMSLQGWHLDKIQWSQLKFKKGKVCRKKYQIFYNQKTNQLKEAGYHLIVNHFGLQIAEVEAPFAQNLFSNDQREKVLKSIYPIENYIAWIVIACVLIFAHFSFFIGISTFNYFIFYLGRSLYNGMIFLVGSFLFIYSFYKLYLGIRLENYNTMIEKIIFVLETIFGILSIIISCLYILQIGILACIVFVVSLLLSKIVRCYSGNNYKERGIRFLCLIVSLGLVFVNTSSPTYDNIKGYQIDDGNVNEDGGSFYKGLYVENSQGRIEGVYESSTLWHVQHLYQYQVERVYKEHFKEIKPYQEVNKKFKRISNGLKYKNEYILLINKRVIYIQDIHTSDVKDIIEYYKALKI